MRVTRWSVLAIVALTLAALVSPVTAIADGPATFTAESPAPASTIVNTPKPTLLVTATDPAGISTGSITLDGVAYGTLYIDYPIGHWEDDGCDTWWVVDDYSVANLRRVPSVSTPALSPGTHSVQVSVTNALGQVSTHSWTFIAEFSPTIVSVSPADGSTVTIRQPQIVVRAADASVDLIGAMTIDGTAVTPAYDSATKTFTYTPAPLEDGIFHTITFTVTDEAGLTASRTWSFQVATSPDTRFREQTPLDGSVVTVLPVTLGVLADDPYSQFNDADTFNLLTLNGSPLTTARSFPVGHWEDDGCEVYYVVDDPTVLQLNSAALTLQDGTYTAGARVRTTSAVTSETAWDFTVAVPPTASDFIPASGSTLTTPLIRARVTDNGPGTPDATMTVNGVIVPATFDAETGYLSYQVVTPLPNGAPTSVEIDMEDASGNTSSASWSFMVDTASTATFYSWSPAPGSTITASSTMLSVYATSANTLSAASARMWLDGRSVAVIRTQPNANTVRGTYTASGMADGVHQVRFQVTDSLGFTSENMWSFTVMAQPTISAEAPARNSITNLPRPPIGATIADNTPGPLNVRITFDGTIVVNEPRPQGAVRWTPPADLLNDSIHSVNVLVTDAAGLTRTSSWSFRVVAPAPMSDGTQCGNCHEASAHPFDNCGACHQTVAGYDPHGPSPAAPLGDCGECHGFYTHTGDYITNCIYCHDGTWAHIPAPHASAQLDPAHVSPATTCTTCHDVALITLHGQYPEGTDFKYQCATCHASADAAVRNAIAAQDARCTACHSSDAHGDLHGSGLRPSCQECHDANLASEHSENCALCHESGDPNVSAAIASGDLACEACHGSADHVTVHVSDGFEAACVECHDGNLVTEHVTARGFTCDTCHDPEAAGGVSGASASAKSGPTVPLGRGTQPAPADGTVGIASEGMTLEDIWEAIASGDTSCAACHTSFHGDMISSTAENPAYPGYLSWSWVTSETVDATGSPHGGYTTTSNKCAVCHSVHRADPGGLVLTPITGGADRALTSYTEGCGFCHGPTSTFSVSRVNIASDFSVSPHTECSRCHAESPHGTGTSAYATLSARLINSRADSAIATDIANARNGMNTVAMGDTSDAAALTLGTGYLCSSCHSSTGADSIHLAFGVNGYNDVPSYVYDSLVSTGSATGHRVTATATVDWNQDGTYGAYYTGGGSVGADSQIAWAPANSCQACHDAKTTAGDYAFPHGYVDDTGAYSVKTTPGASLVWLTVDDRFDADDNAVLGVTDDSAASENDLLSRDGLCLKCHVSTDAASGVGIDY